MNHDTILNKKKCENDCILIQISSRETFGEFQMIKVIDEDDKKK